MSVPLHRLAPLALLVAALGPAHAEPATYAIEHTHTSVTFEILHNNTSTLRGRFGKADGTIQFDRAGRTGRAEVTLEIASLDTGIPAFTKKLMEKKFLDAEGAPLARFVGDRFAFEGDKVREVTGELTLLNRTAPATLRATNFNCYTSPIVKREICGGDFETTIKRSDFGMEAGPPGTPDAVHLLIQVEAIKQS